MLLYYLEFLELGTGTCKASASSMLREGYWNHIQGMIHSNAALDELPSYSFPSRNNVKKIKESVAKEPVYCMILPCEIPQLYIPDVDRNHNL